MSAATQSISRSGRFWTADEFRAGLCDVADIGQPRPMMELAPESDPPPERPALPTLTDEEVLSGLPVKVLKRDAMRAYQALGGAEWLARSPVLLGKILMRLLPVEVNSDERTTLDIKITWASPDRLSYQRTEVIEAEAVDVPAKAIDASTPIEWREVQEDKGLAAVLRHDDKKG